MKHLLAILFLIIAATTVSAQTGDAADKPPCALSVTQAPAINGLKLGMTVEQVLARFPGSSEDKIIAAERARAPEKFGAGSFSIIPEKYSTKDEFPGINQFNFRYIDGHIYSLRAAYNGQTWKDVDEFVSKFAADAKLPAAGFWDATPGMEMQQKELKCSDLAITVFASSGVNHIELRDAASEQLLKERRAKAKEAKP
ncbi:MAG: hypothetical protein JO360_07915 [Acidobacteria bacterium]|nr:hypothetical protein [Acidobacteriota bacterium]